MTDLRFAARQLRRQPVFTAVAVLTLALGVGATTTIFNAAEVALFRPLPFEHEERLVRVFRVPREGTPRISLRPETYRAVERHGSFFDRIVAQRFTSLTLSTPDGPERLIGIAVTAGWAETLGVRPHAGRTFTPDEERLGAASGVALLSHATWQRRFAGDEGMLGRQITLNGSPHTVVGVMQPGLRFPYNADLWLPMRVDDAQVGPWSFNVQARLAPGVSLEAARQELRAIARQSAESGEAPALATEGTTLTAFPLRELFVEEDGDTTLALLGVVAFLLLIVCANLANLLLARGLSRERELAVRASVGASRTRILRQLLTESLLLGSVGSGVGILLASLGGGLARPLLPTRLEFVEADVTMNGLVLAFAVAVGLASTLLFGLVPALRLSRGSPGAALVRSTGTTSGPSGRRLARSLVAAEIALGIVLLTGAGLMLQDLRRLSAIDLGYEPDGLVVFSLDVDEDPYGEPHERSDLLARAVSELDALPGVRAAGATTVFPSGRGNAVTQLEVEGRDDAPGTQRLANHRLVTPGFFEAVGIPLLAGRSLSERDRADRLPVAVVSASLARSVWPGEDPVGKRVRRAGQDEEWLTVSGVVGDVREFYDIEGTWYLPYAQHADERSASSATLTVRGEGDIPPPASLLRAAMARVAPELPMVDLVSARELHRESLARQRQGAGLSIAFAAFGLLLAGLGLYGSVSYAVSRRRREFGIRLALGSERGGIVREVVGEGLRLAAWGAALGVAGALAATRLLGAVLGSVAGFDPVPCALAVLVLTATALAAAAVPAWRAARVDPIAALRE